MEHHKIFAWKEGRFWRGQQLSMTQTRGLLVTLQWRFEVFATIQNYDEAGNCLSCPLYFDFDGPDDQVLADARHFVHALEFLLDVTPRIYFSGNRGFHFIIEHLIIHPQCHLLVQDFAREIAGGLKSLDMKVYRTNAMFRIPNSIGSSMTAYKIELHRSELMSMDMASIRVLAKNQRIIDTAHDPTRLDEKVMEDWRAIAVAKLPTYDNAEALMVDSHNNEMDFTPCLQTMLYEGVDQGRRNEGAFILGKFFKLANIDYDTALDTMLKSPFWARYEADGGREVTKVLKSVYRQSKPPKIGCRGDSQNAELMRNHCSVQCWLREDMPKINPIDDRNAS